MAATDKPKSNRYIYIDIRYIVDVRLAHKLAVGDAIIYATARQFGAELITSDPHFAGLPGVTLL
jgi:predicted nucleic acid-binding protein